MTVPAGTFREATAVALVLSAAIAFVACGGDTTNGGKPQPLVFACESHADCEVVPKSCCGTCGAPTRDDAIAVSNDKRDAYRSLACEDTAGCPACAPLFVDPRLLGLCQGERCELVRLHDHPVAACTEDSECLVRTRDCCECGGEMSPGRLIAIRTDGESYYRDLACDPEQACPACEPLYPAEVTARCGVDAFCEAVDTRVP